MAPHCCNSEDPTSEPVEGGTVAGTEVPAGTRHSFAPTLPMSTYITAMCAGEYHRTERTWTGTAADGTALEVPVGLPAAAFLQATAEGEVRRIEAAHATSDAQLAQLDAELAETIERLQRARIELGLILNQAVPTDLPPELVDSLAFAEQKVAEVVSLAHALEDGPTPRWRPLPVLPSARREDVRARTARVADDDKVRVPYDERAPRQAGRLGLPTLPTATLGSFPQTARIRKARYDLNQDELKPYFEITKVLEDGVFYAANQLYGLSFKKRTDIPVWHPDVVTYEVIEANGKPLGLMYFDYWKRDNKSGGAWMSNLVNQSFLLGTKPVIYNIGNFTKPAAGQPALVSFDDVTTMFHEFGHALHGLFANQTYPSVSGTNTARDFVEFPSQFNEHWALDPKVLPHYAVNYKTGAVIPQALIDKIKKASTFNSGYSTGEALAAAEMDMSWHALPADAPKQDADAFEAKALAATGLDTADVPPRYRSPYFLHIWGNGYSAGYYAYQWTKMLDQNAYNWFEKNGGLTRANGQRFRDMILSKGHTEEYAPMFRAFYGKDPEIGPMLKGMGLNADGTRITDTPAK